MTTYTSPFGGDVIQPTDVSFRSFTLSADTYLSWPVNGNIDGNYAARIMEVSPTTTGLSLYMPPADEVSVGTDALIRNLTATPFTVKTSTGSTIVSIDSGKAEYIYVTTNATSGGTWGIINFGAGTSSADASTLAGLGLWASSTTLNQSHPASGFTNGYTFLSTDRAQAKIWSGGTGTATLPPISAVGNNWFLLLKNNGTGSLTVTPSASQLIDAGTSKVFSPSESAFIICTGSEWITVGYGQNTNFVFNALVKPVTGGSYTISPSEASNTIQEYVGNLSSNVTAVYPPAVNFYVISNQTVDNGYTLTITTGIVGASNAIVPPGNQVTLICDGTNFLNANTTQAGATIISLLNGSLGTPALNFSLETNTGIYRPGAGKMDMVVLGNAIAEFSSVGFSVTGTGTFSGGVSGGVFS